MNFIHTAEMPRLPPFDSLIAFEAVLRHGSMTAAAAELGVTQSAVSHRLRRLEAFIGTPLLRRLRAGLQPTPAGNALAEGFDEILAGMAQLRARSRAALAGRARLRVGLGSALAHHWLVRRLPDFTRRHPGIGIELMVFTTRAQAEAHSGELDLRILWVRPEEARSTSTQRLLFREEVFPVCAPALLEKPLRNPARLASLPLIHKGAQEPDRRGRSPEKQGPEWEWSTWFRRLDLPGKPKTSLHVDEIGTAIAAALEGSGVALARSLLVHDALREGRLLRPLGTRWAMPSGKVHMAQWPAALSGDPRLQTFVDWLARQSEATVAKVTESARRSPRRPMAK